MSNKKGSQFERDFAKELGQWTCADAYMFARRSGSGGAMRDKDGKSGHTGDIHTDKKWTKKIPNPLDHYSVELKFYKSMPNMLAHIFNNKSDAKLDSFMEQAISDAKICNKKPMLAVKRNLLGTIIFIPIETYISRAIINLLRTADITAGVYNWEDNVFIFVSWDSLKEIPYKEIVRLSTK